MSAFSNLFSSLAIQLTGMFGQPIALRRELEGQYNPATGRTEPPVLTNYSALGVPLDFDADEIDGTIIEREDTRIFIHRVVGLIPKVGDLVIGFRDADWRIVNVQIHPVNAVDVLYGLQVRK